MSENNFRKFWNFLKKDTWQSWTVSLLIMLILIKFALFPTISFLTGSSLPLVVVESCSMYHDSRFDSWWNENEKFYLERGITKEIFDDFSFSGGLSKGDVILLWGRGDVSKGDVIIFNPNPEATAKHPIIHRVVSLNPVATKGDNNERQLEIDNNDKLIDETDIPRKNVIGKAALKIPLVGWIKLIFFEPFRDASQRGFC